MGGFMFIKKIYILIILVASLYSLFVLLGQPSKEARPLDELLLTIKELEAKKWLDGEVLIAQQGKILIQAGTPAQYMIGSVSKQFTAVALLRALYDKAPGVTEEEKCDDVKRTLHLPLSTFLQAEAKIWSGKMPAWANEVTLHHLLTHSSGIKNYTATEGYDMSNLKDDRKRWFEFPRSTDEILNIVANDPLEFTPGSKFAYCNTGYVLLAEIIQTLTGTTASESYQKLLFDPLHLKMTANPDRGNWEELKLAPAIEFDPKEITHLSPLKHCEDVSAALVPAPSSNYHRPPRLEHRPPQGAHPPPQTPLRPLHNPLS